MEPGGSMPHSQGPSNYPWTESIHFLVLIPISLRFNLIFHSHLRLGLPTCLFPAGVPVKILKPVLPSSILATWPAHLGLLELIPLTKLGERYNCVAFSTLHSHPSWAQIFASGSCFQIPLACVPLNVRDHVSQPYSTTGNIIVIYIYIYIQILRKWEDENNWTE